MLKKLFLLLLILICNPLNAEVTLDGTLSSSGALPGPDYLIGADLGQQHGGNLFHSFQDFNLNSLESATFSGPNNVQNILSRVTGGNPSNIDGLLRSTIPNADFYFLNPNGIMFGPNAQLDVQGSFHASTADYLRLGDNGRFDARNPSDSLLTVAPIASFGFLTDSPASITTQDSKLSVPYGQTLSLIGGDLSLNGNSPVIFNEGNFMAISARSILSAQGGQINLASAASRGEIIPSELGLELNAEGGQISMDKTLIETSGAGSGAVFIRGGQLVMRDAMIQANKMADQNGKGIDLKLTESINISGELQAILNKSFGSGDAGNVVMATPYLEIFGSHIATTSFAQGNGGDIDIDSKRIRITDGGIGCGAFGSGQCGDFNIKATDSISLLGASKGR
ncbi:MAG: filamentous hemagglutinin N-terminal domain-containing protein, partial [Candidatus Parabeggiatoa sp.]|nr:filamentous hemagglutinin N-terminal domain-containing protein [Candidatus Parabeggiatoa sp.]